MSKHKIISFVKSGIRLIGCVFGVIYFWHQWLPLHAFAFLFLAEILGILEEKFEISPAGESYKAFGHGISNCKAWEVGHFPRNE